MAIITPNGFIYPEYGDVAAVPDTFENNAKKAESLIAYFQGAVEGLHSDIESINGAVEIINTQLGIIAAEIDVVNGAEG